MTNPSQKVLTVVLPAYNERENVDVLVAALHQADIHGQIKRIICLK
jgi:glycosyltransferase involved in cell wall biosynthesis